MSGVHARFHKVLAFINLSANFSLVLFLAEINLHENNVLAIDYVLFSVMEGAHACIHVPGVHFCGGRVFKTDCALKEVFEMVG